MEKEGEEAHGNKSKKDMSEKDDDDMEEGIRIVATTSLSSESSMDVSESIAEGESVIASTDPQTILTKDNSVKDPTQVEETVKNNKMLKLRAFNDLRNHNPEQKKDSAEKHPWNIAEGQPLAQSQPKITSTKFMSVPATNAVSPNTPALGGLVTPIAPGTKIVSSNVLHSPSSKSKLPPGVYRFQKTDGTEAVLIVKDDKHLNKTPLIATRKVSNINSSSEAGYKTPLQIFSSEVSATIKRKQPHLNYSEIQKIVIERWTRMTDSEKQAYREKAVKNTSTIIEPKGISLPSPSEPTTLQKDPRLPEGWMRKLVKRTIGPSAGSYDVYIYTPDGVRIRSTNELRLYIYEHGITNIDPDEIEFKVTVPPLDKQLQPTISEKKKIAPKPPNTVIAPKPLNQVITPKPLSSVIAPKRAESVIVAKPLGPAQVGAIKVTKPPTACSTSESSEVSLNSSGASANTELGRIVHTAGKKMVKMKLAGPNGQVREILVPAIDGPNGTLKVAIPKQYSLPPNAEGTQSTINAKTISQGLREIRPKPPEPESNDPDEVQVMEDEDPLASDDEVVIDDGDDEWTPDE